MTTEIKCNYQGCLGSLHCKIDRDSKNIVGKSVNMDIFKAGTGCAHDEQQVIDVVTRKTDIPEFDERTIRTKPKKISNK